MVNEWTRADLPAVMDLVKASVDAVATDPSGGAYAALDAVVEHLNAHHPKPRPIDEAEFLDLYIDVIAETSGLERRALWSHRVWAKKIVERLNANGGAPASRGDAALADHLGRQAEAIDELQLDLEAAERDRARWRRAHEIVEAERDQARRERDKWEEKYLDTDEALHRARASLHEACKVAQSYKVDAYQATERAEAAEARTAPAVTREDVEGVIDRWVEQGGNHEALLDDLWRWASGSDPILYAIRESDLPEAWRDRQVWRAGQSSYFRVTPEDMRSVIPATLGMVAARESVARAIEAEEAEAVDPVEELAGQIESATRDAIRQVCDTFATVAPTLDPLAVEQAMEVTSASRKIAAHVLGQEDRHVDQ